MLRASALRAIVVLAKKLLRRCNAASPAAIHFPKPNYKMPPTAPSADFLAALNEYQPLLRRVARLYCQDADDRQDLFQEMVLQLWRNRLRIPLLALVLTH